MRTDAGGGPGEPGDGTSPLYDLITDIVDMFSPVDVARTPEFLVGSGQGVDQYYCYY